MFTKSIMRRRRNRQQRKGTATVEFAIVLPVLLFLTIGTLDLCSLMFLRESATIAAYEGARRGVGRGRTNADAIARVTEFLDERDISYQSSNVCQIPGTGFGAAETLENVTVTVNIPAAGNLLIPSEMFGDMTLSSSVTMRKEYKNLPTGG